MKQTNNSDNFEAIIALMSFICQAYRTDMSTTYLVSSTPEIHLQVDTTDLENPLSLQVSFKERPLEFSESNCWQLLFSTGVVATPPTPFQSQTWPVTLGK